MAGSRTFSANQRTPSPNAFRPNTLFEQENMRTLSTWGSDFTALQTSPYSPGSNPSSPQRGRRMFSPFETGQLGDSQFLSTTQGKEFLLAVSSCLKVFPMFVRYNENRMK